MKVAMGAFAFVIIIAAIMLAPNVISGVDDARTDERIDALSAPTGIGETTADVVLNQAMWQGDIASVVSITSDVGTDIPNPDTYVAGTRTLTVRDLTANTTPRTLTITYLVSAFGTDNVEASAGTFVGFWPLFFGIAVLVLIIGIGFSIFSKR